MKPTILIADDSATMRLGLKTMLSLEGFQVALAEDGDEAMGQLKRGLKPDLIITDLNTPRMDGLALIRAARELLVATPILMLTVENRRDKRELARLAGATGWIVKPVRHATLLKAIHRVVPQP